MAKLLFKTKIRYSLANQLVVSFLVMFLLIFTLSSVFVYLGFLNILKSNAKDNNLQQFKQFDYNLSTFSNEVDQTSRQLVLNTELQSLIDYKNLSEIDRVLQMGAAFRNFTQMMSNFKYIDSISFYGEDGFIISSNVQGNYIKDDNLSSKQTMFYRSEMYNKVSLEAQKMFWFGGFTDEDFSLSAKRNVKPPLHYITAARGILSNNHIGTLVINVNMKYFTDIYNRFSDPQNNEMYIIDSSDKIVSHSNEAKIGSQGKNPLQLKSSNMDNAIFFSGEQDGKQITSYKIGSLGWTLINEIPVSIFTKDILKLRQIVISMFIFSFLLAIFLSRYWIQKMTQPLLRLITVIKKMGQGNLGLTLDLNMKNELGVLITQFNLMSKNIAELLEQKETIQEEKRKLEIGALQAQINPHFLYNTLNTIKWMAIMIKAGNIEESITTLSDLLHPMFKKNDLLCSIKEEIQYIENYIKIMNYRFAGSFKAEILISDAIMDYQIHRFILQPLVENAIYHGLLNQNGGAIQIIAAEQNDEIIICVIDNGEGMPDERLQEVKQSLVSINPEEYPLEKGIGLRNVNRRIQLHFGDSYKIQIESEPHIGTKVFLNLPKVQKSFKNPT